MCHISSPAAAGVATIILALAMVVCIWSVLEWSLKGPWEMNVKMKQKMVIFAKAMTWFDFQKMIIFYLILF